MLSDERLLPNEKLTVLVELMYPEPPENTAAAVSQALKFLDMGEETDGGKAARVFDFCKDARFIYTAFRFSFNIDLNSVENLHWWAFKSMLSDLSGECFFNTLIRLRSRKAKGKLTIDRISYQISNFTNGALTFLLNNIKLIGSAIAGATTAVATFKVQAIIRELAKRGFASKTFCNE